MSRPKNEIATHKVTVQLKPGIIMALDRAALDARGAVGAHVDRSSIIAAVIESADLPAVALRVAKGRAS